MATEIRPISIDIAWADDGQTAKGATIREAVFADGDFVQLMGLKPLAESTVKAVLPYAEAFSASAIAQVATLTAERDAALRDVATRTDQSDVITGLRSEISSLTTERNTLLAKLESMTAHPDVVAAEKAKAIADAKEKRVAAIAEKQAAEAKLAELGEGIEAAVEETK